MEIATTMKQPKGIPYKQKCLVPEWFGGAAAAEEKSIAEPSGEERKAKGQAKLAAKWYVPAMDRMFEAFLARLPWMTGTPFTVEDVREFADQHHWASPSAKDYVALTAIHVNSWGGMFTRASHRHLIERTEKWPKAKRAKANGRRIQQWRIKSERNK